MILYQYQKRIEELPSDGSAYFMTDALDFANKLMQDNVYSTEVNIINKFRDEYKEKGKDLNFIDVGANVGTYSMVLGRVFNHTYAFEPCIHSYNILCGNIALNNLSYKVTPINKGLSNKKQILPYYDLDIQSGNNMFKNSTDDKLVDIYADWIKEHDIKAQELEVNTLDSYNITNVGLIKIDVEGSEYKVLKGAEKTIVNNNYPPMLIESWNPEGENRSEIKKEMTKLRNNVFKFLKDKDYKIEFLGEDLFYCEKVK